VVVRRGRGEQPLGLPALEERGELALERLLVLVGSPYPASFGELEDSFLEADRSSLLDVVEDVAADLAAARVVAPALGLRPDYERWILLGVKGREPLERAAGRPELHVGADDLDEV